MYTIVDKPNRLECIAIVQERVANCDPLAAKTVSNIKQPSLFSNGKELIE